MKQLIVLLATVILGLSIAGIVKGMGDDMDTVTDGIIDQIETTLTVSE